MNNKILVKLSNIIGLISILLLVYWVFIFISIQVFGLKIFRENMTETFYLSILGILALMSGALITNIMFNLTRIAEKHNQDTIGTLKTKSKKLPYIFALSFPVIFALLFTADHFTSQKKEKLLIESAISIVERNPTESNKLLQYSFDKKWILETADILDIYSKTDENFPSISVIVADSIDNSKVFLGFQKYLNAPMDTLAPRKSNFIEVTSKEEREYLNSVFYKNVTNIRFSAHDGRYELFYPYVKNGKRIVLYFSDFQRYGKYGS